MTFVPASSPDCACIEEPRCRRSSSSDEIDRREFRIGVIKGVVARDGVEGRVGRAVRRGLELATAKARQRISGVVWTPGIDDLRDVIRCPEVEVYVGRGIALVLDLTILHPGYDLIGRPVALAKISNHRTCVAEHPLG